MNDGVAEIDETLRLRLTSSNVGGNISDTGIGMIYDGGTIPELWPMFVYPYQLGLHRALAAPRRFQPK